MWDGWASCSRLSAHTKAISRSFINFGTRVPQTPLQHIKPIVLLAGLSDRLLLGFPPSYRIAHELNSCLTNGVIAGEAIRGQHSLHPAAATGIQSVHSQSSQSATAMGRAMQQAQGGSCTSKGSCLSAALDQSTTCDSTCCCLASPLATAHQRCLCFI